LKAEQEARQSETVVLTGQVMRETQPDEARKTNGSVTIRAEGMYKWMTFPKSQVERLGTLNGLDVFEVAAWKVRKDYGDLTVEALNGKRDATIKAMEGQAKKKAA
jgi:hypothetical protein